jgi:5-methylcytosine-specific restriction endonuclease McrA
VAGCQNSVYTTSTTGVCDAHKHTLAKTKARVKAWVAAHPERQAEHMSRWLRRNRTRHNARNRRWDRSNRPARRAALLRYRTRMTGAGGSFTPAEWDAVLECYGHRCRHCACDGALEVDHVIPVSRGGCSNIWNLQPLCRPCNARKGNQVLGYL